MYNTQAYFSSSSFSSLSAAFGETSSSFAPTPLPLMPQPVATSPELEAPTSTPAPVYYPAGVEAGASNSATPLPSTGPHTPVDDIDSQWNDYGSDFFPSQEQCDASWDQFWASWEEIPAAAGAANPNNYGVPIITGDTHLDSLLLERYFPESRYNHRIHELRDISCFYEISCVPDWLGDVLGAETVNLFRAEEGFRGNSGTGAFVPTFVPYLYLRSEQGNELVQMSWELLARMEMCGGGHLNRWDTVKATAPNGVTVSVLSREHFHEIALFDPKSITNRKAFLPNRLFVTGGMPPFLLKAPVPGPVIKADITNALKAWFEGIANYMDDEPQRVVMMAQAIRETQVTLAARAAAKGATAASRSGKSKRRRDSDVESENVEKPKKAKRRKT